MAKPRKRRQYECDWCHKKFERLPSHVKSKKVYCSYHCAAKARNCNEEGKGTYTCQCGWCHKKFERIPSQIRSEKVYCSNRCAAIAKQRDRGHTGEKKTYKCCWCDKKFERSPANVRSEKVYCSPRCYVEAQQATKFVYLCSECGNKFERKYCLIKGKKYCSRECMTAARFLKDVRKTSKGYIYVFVGHEYPNVTKRGYILKHRYVVEQNIGRPLKSHEIVHHKNGVRDDNRIENLEVRTTTTHPQGYDNELLEQINEFIQKNNNLTNKNVELQKQLDMCKEKLGSI